MAATAAGAEELQQALATNLARLQSAANYLARLSARGDFEAMCEADECRDRIDALLEERTALRERR